MFPARRILKLSFLGGAAVGGVGYAVNQFGDPDSIGIIRFGRAATTVLDIARLYRRTIYAKEYDVQSAEYKELRSQVHYEAAEKLLDLCRKNKGMFVKVGQHIGALEYLLPAEYVQTMKVLHSKAPDSSLKDILKVIKQEFGKDPADIFEEFSEEPIGVASLAQVHIARLKPQEGEKKGELLAVKVQHPTVKFNADADLKTMEFLVKVVSWAFPDFKFMWVVDETKKNIPKELDFYLEGQNAEKARTMFASYPWLKIPKVFWNLTTSRVLTMEYVEGAGQVNDLEYIRREGIDPYLVASRLGNIYSEMIFKNGFVHSDPHPGNILVRKRKGKLMGDVELVLLDHGLYADLTDNFRATYSRLWMHILNGNPAGMRKEGVALGIAEPLYALFACMVSGRKWESINRGLEVTKFTASEKHDFQKEIPHLLPQITDVLATVDRQMLLILKTNDLLRGIEYTLRTHTRMGSFRVMADLCVKSYYQERLMNSKSKWETMKISLEFYWAVVRLYAYYAVLPLMISRPTFPSLKDVIRNALRPGIIPGILPS
ncbi:aarF domain-containing kinase 1 [Ischnura elegans]|uniref:aarF domain-containing kinase 1 n=1 Tax=Ischnura elegans TaxID=197161 RepID=UPI001ED87704|nr:aarF domain-containing kinase 1 [Ischnura elegans]